MPFMHVKCYIEEGGNNAKFCNIQGKRTELAAFIA